MGYLLLQGGGEFGGAMRESDLHALDLVGFDMRMVIIPTAAAPDHNDQRAGQNGVDWFKSLGATDVNVLPLVDAASANDPEIIVTLLSASLIYLLGGDTHYLAQTLVNSESYGALQTAYSESVVVAGSSAGAMALCEYYFDPNSGKIEKGLNFLPNACVIPHHNTFGKSWAGRLRSLLPDSVLIGIDEETGLIQEYGEWTVYGGGVVTIYGEEQKVNRHGEKFPLH
ncbi:MAG: Type 1 glutamine amidotransferase-like domain-containing protein [Chloroflexi bacterium]|nr:Type 1 glutamine amidotransferase-like domain-containing protein [Chloroflexota bacterium]MBI5080256.1 Type 1 glutamine amidotransferase-like domain-containing protein [Chloroflexota bacterium]MBI5715401.1 Type 1 glutamine amidotransferase-like domain-containing protein [Chloroflexota bacterium]